MRDTRNDKPRVDAERIARDMISTVTVQSYCSHSSLTASTQSTSSANKGHQRRSSTVTRWRLIFLTIGTLVWLLWAMASAIASTANLDETGINIDSTFSIPKIRLGNNTTGNNTNETSWLRTPDSPPYLLVIIPTMPRTKATNYLTETLTAIQNELLHIQSAQNNIVHVHVVNTRPSGNHSEFYELKQKFQTNTQFTFLETDGLDGPDPGNYTEEPVVEKGPGLNQRRQTRDLVKVMRLSMHTIKTSKKSGGGLPEHAMVWEDDFKPCFQAFLALIDVISRLYDPARPHKGDWFALRTSYGFNGVVQRGRDVLNFCDYLLKHQHRRPPDHLLVEWFVSETDEAQSFRGDRYHATFFWHVYEHQGTVSSLRGEEQNKKLPGCWSSFNKMLFKDEQFRLGCKRKGDDITPCPDGVRRANYKVPTNEMRKMPVKILQSEIRTYQRRNQQRNQIVHAKLGGTGRLGIGKLPWI